MSAHDQRLASAESHQTADGNFCKLGNLNSMQKRIPIKTSSKSRLECETSVGASSQPRPQPSDFR